MIKGGMIIGIQSNDQTHYLLFCQEGDMRMKGRSKVIFSFTFYDSIINVFLEVGLQVCFAVIK